MIRPSAPLLHSPGGQPLVDHECQMFAQAMQASPHLASACKKLLTHQPLDAKALAVFEGELDARGSLFSFPDSNTIARARAFRLGCMMHWGLSQPWAAAMDLGSLAVSWWEPFELEKHQAHLRTGHIFVDFVGPLSLVVQTQGSSMPKGWCKTLFDGLEQTVPWTKYASFKQAWCHPIFLAMGQLAGELDATVRLRWSRLAKQAVDTMDEQEQNALLDTILASSLQNAQKRQAAQTLPAHLWLQDLRPLHLSAILASNEKKRFLQLGWGDDPATNQRLCQTYCPAIAQALQPMEPRDWKMPSKLWKGVQKMPLENADASYAIAFGDDLAL